MKHTYISIGQKCSSAVRRAKKYNLSNRNGYKTCPFDLMVSNLEGVIKCFKNDFVDFCDPEMLIYEPDDTPCENTDDNKKEVFITHKLYGFCFNHETPGHANLHLKEKWPGEDKFYFVKNNYEMFVKRYEQRIKNLKEIIKNHKKITLIYDDTKYELCPESYSIEKRMELINELRDVLKNKYPNKQFNFDIFNDRSKIRA